MNGKINVLLAIGLVIVAVVLALNGGKTATQDTLAVTGFYEESVMPDKAELFLSVETTKDTADLSQEENSKISKAVRDALLGMGVKENEIETETYTIYPKEVWDEKNSEYKLEGYVVLNTLKITTKDIMNTGKYLDAAVSAGANRVERVVFGLTKEKEREVSQQLLQKAGENAKSKAVSIASGMGVKLGKIVAISESNYNIQPYYYSTNVRNMAAGKTENIISPQSIQTNANIYVTYKI